MLEGLLGGTPAAAGEDPRRLGLVLEVRTSQLLQRRLGLLAAEVAQGVGSLGAGLALARASHRNELVHPAGVTLARSRGVALGGRLEVALLLLGLARGVRLGLGARSEEHTSELQSLAYLVCRL